MVQTAPLHSLFTATAWQQQIESPNKMRGLHRALHRYLLFPALVRSAHWAAQPLGLYCLKSIRDRVAQLD